MVVAGVIVRARAAAPRLVRMLRPRSARLLVAAGLLLATVIAAATILLIHDLYWKALHDTEQSLSSLSAVLADQADRAFQAIDLVQQAVIDEVRLADISTETAYVARVTQHSVHESLRTRVSVLPQANAVTVIDAQGKLLNFSRYWPVPTVNVADRDYFRALVGDPEREAFVSEPVPNRGDGTWTVYNARKISAPDGTFLGLVLGAVELRYFEHLYERIAPEPDYAFSLFRNGGVLLARYPPLGNSIGRSSAPLVLARAENPGGKAVRQATGLDGKQRLVAVRTLEHYPIDLQVSRTIEAALAPWRKQLIISGSAGFLLDLGLLGLVTLGVLQLRSHERLSDAARREVAERTRGEEMLRVQYSRFGTALDNMTQGLCMFDRSDRLIVMNDRFAHMYALPAGLRLPGTSFNHIASGMALKAGETAASAFQQFAAEPAAARICAEQGSLTLELADERSISIAYAPIPDGGWVCTHEDITERKKSEARIVHMALHDALTGLPNRARLREHMKEVQAGIRRGASAATLCLDLDGFKQVNDTLGHPTGDQVLRQVAQRLRDQTRKSDLVVRLGGDEFAVVLTDAERPDEAAQLAERLVRALRVPFDIGGHRIEIGTSIGVCLAQTSETTADDMLRSADIALYYAKAAGRGTWRLFEVEMDVEIRRRRALTDDLKQALDESQFEIFYQPLVQADTEHVIGFEGLLRWRHPTRGLVSPADFIPIAEESGLIHQIGGWVLRRVCSDAAAWPHGLIAAVNLSPVQFIRGDLVRDVEQALTHSGLEPTRLELEITETVLLQDNESTLAQLHRLRALGVSICMDDFGTGYSSLSYLRRFPFDKIKVDQSFVRSLHLEQGSIEILRAIVGLGRALGMRVLAEGIETQEQRDVLRAEGYEELQGYFFGRPQPNSCIASQIAEVEARISRVAIPAA